MKRTAIFSTLVAAGMLTAAPAIAAAQTDTTTAPTDTTTAPTDTAGSPTSGTPTSTTAPPSTTPTDDGSGVGTPKAYLRLLPATGRAGDNVTVRVGCEAKYISQLASAALEFGPLHQVGPQNDPDKAPVSEGGATVRRDVRPGTYQASFDCGGAQIATEFTVLPAKQVAQVPAGAPQTGGTDGPAGDSPGLPAAAAMGALAVGGTGLVVARRRVRG
ncbi:hypothetical protein [Amycolatopsis jiangsuensis]|uniref:Gram-positive cocci surface proteins LPxTG domain-containing protein n=1 Tax=Amycolatopsis jiangsuensis TaxID=1181879 RepID=A0A840IU70_9PSEU|nr:hypothetical protein [Amycolatopsis jiangsuensis]MBB4686211.1 hypothetical protein [Amycolatopsis jiangsuensis]